MQNKKRDWLYHLLESNLGAMLTVMLLLGTITAILYAGIRADRLGMVLQ